ncbi:hypothetical protein [Haliangium sp.]|uniref:hypothetical protein n=1 Tax=Haliangium sp. TaxID=2663208 RepID=UPI003D0BB90B
MPRTTRWTLLLAAMLLLPWSAAHAQRAGDPPAAEESADAGDTDEVGEADSDAQDSDSDGGEEESTPAPDSAADAEAIDIDALRQEYLSLRDELFRSRARAAAVASALYSTRLRVHLDYDSARFYTVTRSSLRLDGANVFDDSAGVIGADRVPRFEGFVAPGRHLIAVRIEAVGKDDERFSSIVENTFTVQAPAGKDVIVRIRARDAGDIPYSWQKQERGSYKLYLDVAIETAARAEAAPKPAAAAPAPSSPRHARASAPRARHARQPRHAQ